MGGEESIIRLILAETESETLLGMAELGNYFHIFSLKISFSKHLHNLNFKINPFHLKHLDK